MKRVFLLIALCALCGAATVRAQQVLKRVQFTAGSTTAVMEGRTDSSSSVIYRLRARAGQHMTVHLNSAKKDVKCQIRPTNDHMLPGAQDVTRWEGDLPKDGDYDILVFIVTGSATYTLEVAINPGASDKGGAPMDDERGADLSAPGRPQGVAAYDGHYILNDNAPRGLKDFAGFDLTTANFTRQGPVPVKPSGLVYAGRKYRMARINIEGDHFSFETAAVAGTTYQFDGKFLHSKGPNAPVLEGLLTKVLNGKTVAEARVAFIIEEGGE